jgi:tRNA pseudouridine55 synthase
MLFFPIYFISHYIIALMFDLNLFHSSIINEDKTGVLLVDKPSGITSHDVVDQARKLSGHRRVGHTGTLDPLASGLLIILIGRQYTKLQSIFLKLDKEYEVTGQLGLETDSYDSDGLVLAEANWTDIAAISEADVSAVLRKFRGQISQTVPAFSAVKINGKKLYQLARSERKNREQQAEPETSVVPKLPVREVTISKLELIKFAHHPDLKKVFFSLRATCSSGTYIRSLVHDIGKQLGVGATVTQLRRTKIAKIDIKHAQTIDNYFPK